MFRYIIILLTTLLFSNEGKTIASREFVQNGRIDASVISNLDYNNLMLVQLDVLNDSLLLLELVVQNRDLLQKLHELLSHSHIHLKNQIMNRLLS